MRVCVWRCGHACSACVWCVVGIVWGLWGVWMGHGVVVADSPHPHHGHLWCVLVEVVGGSCGKCSEGMGACVSGEAACWGMRRNIASLPAFSSALQHRICPHPHPMPHLKAIPSDTTVSGAICVRWGSLPHPFLRRGARTCVCGCTELWWHLFFWCLV